VNATRLTFSLFKCEIASGNGITKTKPMRNVLTLAAGCACTFAAAGQPFEFHTTLTQALTGSGSPAIGYDLNQHYPGNNPPETFPPITLDTAAHTLRLPIGWGTPNSGQDLQSPYQESWLYRDVGGTPDLLYSWSTVNDQGGGGAAGSYDVTVPLAPISGYTVAAQEQDIRNGLWFLRIDSVGFPNGEIAGQLTPVPEPEHYAMLAGLWLIGFAVYRQVKSTRAV
jgi:hypothetical protein